MSVYPPPTQLHQRQASSSSSISSYTSNYFPDSRSTTVTSTSSSSSRFSNKSEGPAAADGMSRKASNYSVNNGLDSPPLRPILPPTSPSRSSLSRHSYHENGRAQSPAQFTFPSGPRSASPTKSAYREADINPNRRSIVHTTTTIPADINRMRNSSVSHLRTLSQISNGASDEFKATVSEEVHGMHGRKRLQRANTEGLSSWERLNWMDKRRQYIQAYEYLCHIGEAKELVYMVFLAIRLFN